MILFNHAQLLMREREGKRKHTTPSRDRRAHGDLGLSPSFTMTLLLESFSIIAFNTTADKHRSDMTSVRNNLYS